MTAILDGLRVVLVDDDEDVRDVIQIIMEGQGARVVPAADAETALAVLESMTPDILVSDIRMPRHDGWWLVNQARSQGFLDGVPTLAVTGFDVTLQQLDARTFDEYLRKPVDAHHLCMTVRRLARDRPPRSV
jgi:CheY-like chemotaxis protein